MTQAFNLSRFANKVNTSGQADASTAFTGTISTANLPTIPTTLGGTGLTTVGTNGQVIKSNGSSLAWGSVSGTIAWQSVQTTNFTATSNYGYPVNTTSGAITITLPASPTAGDMISIIDYAGTAATNNITLNINGNKIEGTTFNKVIQTNREGLTIVYADATQGWLSVSDVYSTTPYVNAPYTVEYIVVAGGGGGNSGGGGAGGYRTASNFNITSSTSYTVTIGGGGTGGASGTPTNGSDSVFSTITSTGGGKGGQQSIGSTSGNGGSGGGGGRNTTTFGTGTSGQGNNGGAGSTSSPFPAGGGGGAGATGGTGSGSVAGGGGIGLSDSWTGSTRYLAGGGGGSLEGSGVTGGAGGNGGGGNGSASTGAAGTANTGGGGGGGVNVGPDANGGNGGSGIVVIRYSGSQRGTGGTVTSSGGYTLHTFTSSGTYVG